MFEQVKLYALVAGAVLIALVSATGAWKVQEWRYKALEAAQVDRAQEDARIRVRVANKASTGHEQDKAALSTQFLTIEKEVEHVVTQVVYRDRACFDPDGVQLVQQAIRATAGASEPSNHVPPTAKP